MQVLVLVLPMAVVLLTEPSGDISTVQASRHNGRNVRSMCAHHVFFSSQSTSRP